MIKVHKQEHTIALIKHSVPFIITVLLTAWATLSAHATIQGPDPAKRGTQYLVEHWTIEEGLPNLAVLTTAQDQKGYVWLGTFDGLARFDGLKFTVYNSQTHPEFKNNGMQALHATEGDSLLIGTNGSGLLFFDGETLRRVAGDSVMQSHIITEITSDSHGGYWIGTRSGVYHMDAQERVTSFDEHPLLATANVYDLIADRMGELWVAANGNGVLNFNGKQVTQYSLTEGLPTEDTRALLQDAKGRMWVGTSLGLFYFQRGRFEALEQAEGEPILSVNTLLQDKRGTMWVGTEQGLVRYVNGQLTKIYGTDDFDTRTIQHLLLDHEGSLWAGTYRSGLYQVKDSKFTNWGVPEGLSNDVVNAVLNENGITWVGTDEGLMRMAGGEVESVYLGSSTGSNRVRDLLRDSQGRLWACTYGGLYELEGSTVKRKLTMADGLSSNRVRNITEDRNGNLWVGTADGLCQIGDGVIATYGAEAGLLNTFILATFPAQDGTVWVGTNGGGIYRVSDGALNAVPGFPGEIVFRMHQDPQGNLWAGSNLGVVFLSREAMEGRVEVADFKVIGSRNGLPIATIFQILADGEGYYWLTSDKGLYRVPYTQLLEVATGPEGFRLSQGRLFSKEDGLRHHGVTGVSVSAVGTNGRLYFSCLGGVAEIDPQYVLQNTLPPNVVIEGLRTSTPYTLENQAYVLKAGNRRVEIDFTALSFLAAKQIAFEYKLEDFDPEWQTVSDMRQVQYTNLPPGRYTFMVKAANNDGIWNEEGASIRIVQKAFFYQETWFYVLCAVVFIVALVGWSRYRTARLKNRNHELELVVEERTQAIKAQSRELQDYYNKMTKSITYARRIQDAQLPALEAIRSYMPECFIMYQPKDVVSGDFYWFTVTGHKLVLVGADCTGHGVPGAFMSVLGNTLLNQIVNAQGITEPHEILEQLNVQVQAALQQSYNEKQAADGMDLALVVLDTEERLLKFAGAKRPLYYVQKGKLEVIKGDRMPIGGKQIYGAGERFNTHELPLDDLEFFYLTSDGYADQFGGEKGQKFMSKRFKHLLQEVHTLPAESQSQQLNRVFTEWQGQKEQVDDVLVIGASPMNLKIPYVAKAMKLTGEAKTAIEVMPQRQP